MQDYTTIPPAELPVYDQEGNLLEAYDLERGYLTGSTHLIHHPAVEGVTEEGHWETLQTYPNGGKDVRWVVDVPGVTAAEAWDEEAPCQVYIPYTQEQLDAIEAERSKPTMDERMSAAELAAQEARDAVSSYRELLTDTVVTLGQVQGQAQVSAGVLRGITGAVGSPAVLTAMRVAAGGVARTMARDPATANNDVIDLAPLLRPWAPGHWAAGEVCAHDGVPYRVAQEHDSTDNPDWMPDKTPALWAPYHATDLSHALPWHQPTGAHDMYKQGEWMIWTDGAAWQCVEDTSYSPEDYPAAWKEAESTWVVTPSPAKTPSVPGR